MCEHKRLKCVNNVLSCMDCGEVLPLEFLDGKKYERKFPKMATKSFGELQGPKKTAKRAKKEG